MVGVPALLGVKLTVQVSVPVPWVQALGPNVVLWPLSEVPQLTFPLGVLLPEARVTVAVQELVFPRVTGVEQVTVVVVSTFVGSAGV